MPTKHEVSKYKNAKRELVIQKTMHPNLRRELIVVIKSLEDMYPVICAL